MDPWENQSAPEGNRIPLWEKDRSDRQYPSSTGSVQAGCDSHSYPTAHVELYRCIGACRPYTTAPGRKERRCHEVANFPQQAPLLTRRSHPKAIAMQRRSACVVASWRRPSGTPSTPGCPVDGVKHHRTPTRTQHPIYALQTATEATRPRRAGSLCPPAGLASSGPLSTDSAGRVHPGTSVRVGQSPRPSPGRPDSPNHAWPGPWRFNITPSDDPQLLSPGQPLR